MAVNLEAIARTIDKQSTIRKIREEGNIPAILNGNHQSKPILVNSIDFIKTIRESGRNGIINLKLDNENHPVMLHEVQQDPIKSEIIHVDFKIVNMRSEVEVDVNVHLVGEAVGVKDGGVLQQSLHTLSVKALPNNIPQSIDVDISNMEVGQTITVGDINTGGSYELVGDESHVIASVLAPRQEEEIDSGEEQEDGLPASEEGREGEEQASEE